MDTPPRRHRIPMVKPSVQNVRFQVPTLIAIEPSSAVAIPRLRGQAGVDRRARWLSKYPLCKQCDEASVVRAAAQVDHVVPLFQGGVDDETNLQSLCIPCHQRKTAIETGHIKANAFPRWLEPAKGFLTIVFGPPGAGKSALIRDRAQPGDVVIDMDAIRAELSGMPIYHADDEQWRNVSLRERNRRLGKLVRYPGAAWFAVTGTGERERKWWQEHLRPARVIVLDTPLAICIARIMADNRRPADVKLRHCEVARRWWDWHGS